MKRSMENVWHSYQSGKVFFFVVVRFRLIAVGAGTASRWWAFVGNDGAQAARFDLSLEAFNSRFMSQSIKELTLESLKIHYWALVLGIFHHRRSEPLRLHWHVTMLNLLVTTIQNNLQALIRFRRVSLLPLSIQPNSINHFRSSNVIIRRHNDGYFL